jgi:hypothetical protein
MTDYFSIEKSKMREKDISVLLGSDILRGESMSRLREVSFLGVLNLVADVPESLRFSRYDHSVSVAYLTWCFCKNLKIREDVSLTTTLAALIHDITHPPFSHSAEVYLQIRSGLEIKHTSVLTEQKIVKVVKEGYDSFPRSLQKETPEKLAKKLYELLNFRDKRQGYHTYLTDIFDAPFCPDTFDGINRAWHALNTLEVKQRLVGKQNKYFEPIDPRLLIRDISATSPYPFILKSASPPSKFNLIYKFHGLMRTLYNDIIYSDWQSSAMIMFVRTLELAYRNASKFEINQIDADVLKRIRKNPSSNNLYNLIIKGYEFSKLSKENPILFKYFLEQYARAKKQKKSDNEIKKRIESMVAMRLNTERELVFWYKYRPLMWSPAHIQFSRRPNDETLWSLKWDQVEGEPNKEFEIEIYYTEPI